MEIVAALPPDLAAIADPSARGAAPLLRPPQAEADSPPAVAPFELYLALLTGAQPGGEAWPPAGNDLPVATPQPQPLPTLEAEPGALAALLSPALAALATGPADTLQPDAVPVPLAGTSATLPAGVLGEGLAGTARFPTVPLLDGMAVASQAEAVAKPAEPLAVAPSMIDAIEVAVVTTELPTLKPSVPSWLAAMSTRAEPAPAPPALLPGDVRAALAPPAAAPPAGVVPNMRAVGLRSDASTLATVPSLDASPSAGSLVSGAEPAALGRADWLPTAGPTHHTMSTPSAAAPPGAPVDLRSPTGPEAFATRVQWLVDQHVGEAHIKLNPPELGAVEVKISLVEDKAFVQLTTATSAARDELSQNLPRLRELFTTSGLELGGASVHGRESRHDGGAQTHGRPLADAPTPFIANDDSADGPVRWQRQRTSRIDVFA